MNSVTFTNKRNILYLNSMPFEMLMKQGRKWELTSRALNGYCRLACSVFWGSKKNRVVELEPGKNICYCIYRPFDKVNVAFFRQLYRIFYVVILAYRLKIICKEKNIDAIISNSNALRELEVAAIITSRIFSIPIFGYVGRNPTGMEFDKYFSIEEIQTKNKTLVNKLEKYILKCVDKVITRPSGEITCTKLYEVDPNKIVLIPHVTKFNEFAAHSKLPDDLKEWMKNKKIIMSYGRLSSEKFFDDMIRSVSIVKKNHKNVYFLLIGDGEEKENLIRLVNQLHLSESVRFEKSMPQYRIATIASRCNILVHLCGGKAMFESAVLGRPLITYNMDRGHFYGLIKHMKTALVAKYRDIDNMAKCMNMYLNDRDLCTRLGMELKRIATQHNDCYSTVNKLCTAIEAEISAKQ